MRVTYPRVRPLLCLGFPAYLSPSPEGLPVSSFRGSLVGPRLVPCLRPSHAGRPGRPRTHYVVAAMGDASPAGVPSQESPRNGRGHEGGRPRPTRGVSGCVRKPGRACLGQSPPLPGAAWFLLSVAVGAGWPLGAAEDNFAPPRRPRPPSHRPRKEHRNNERWLSELAPFLETIVCYSMRVIDPKTVTCPACLSGVNTPCRTSAYGGTHRARRIAAERHAHERAVAKRHDRGHIRYAWD